MVADTLKIPLSRSVLVSRITSDGIVIKVETTPEERLAIASDFKLPALTALRAEYRLTGTPDKVAVRGRVWADISQVCVVTLEVFDSSIDETVEVDFVAEGKAPKLQPDDDGYFDVPDEISNGQIDLGQLTAEFLALGLDPYPRKPGVDFMSGDGSPDKDSPFAKLDKLKSND